LGNNLALVLLIIKQETRLMMQDTGYCASCI